MKKTFSYYLRPIALFATVWAALLLCNALCFALAARGYNLPPVFSAVTALCLSLLLAYSLSRLLVLFTPRELLYEGRKAKGERLRFLWARPILRAALLLFFLLPLPYPAFAPLFGAYSPLLRYLISRVYLLPLLLAFLLGSLTGLSYREQNPKEQKNTAFFLFLLHALKYILIYSVGALLLLLLSATLISLPALVALVIVSRFGVAILVLFLALWVFRILRAIRKRRKFLRALEAACASRRISMPKIKDPICSLFKRGGSDVFYITVRGKKYACRMVSSLKRGSIFRFYPDGKMAKVHVMILSILTRGRFGAGSGGLHRQRTELWEKQYDVAFEAEGATKVLIFNPCSKIVELKHGDDSVPLDNGMTIGEYKFFTASGFTGAVARDCLDRKPNE